MKHRHLVIDARAMAPAHVLESARASVCDFAPGDTLKLVIDREPQPLFRMLQGSGYGWHIEPGRESVYEITIWAR